MIEKFLALKASAGSGKTFRLVLRISELLLSGANTNEILALTFTKKAANEMKFRLIRALKGEDEGIKQSLIELGYKDDLDKKLRESFYKVITNNINIMTIDSFFHKILRKFCFYADVNPNFSVSSDREELIIGEFLDSLITDNEAFLKAIFICSEYEKSLEYLIGLFKFLLFKHIDEKYQFSDEKIIFNTMKEVEAKAFNKAKEIKQIVLNSYIASDSAKKAVNFENFSELLEKSWLKKETLSDYRYFNKLYTENLDKLFLELKKLLKHYFELKEELFLSNLFMLFKFYKNSRNIHKKQFNELSFDDVAIIVFKLLTKEIDREFLYFRLDNKISHILIDEFQDTSTLQYEILLPLIDEIKSGVGQKEFKTLFIVGDPKQSIYRFRGANSMLFDIATKDLKKEELFINYRSKNIIVDFVNRTFKGKIDGYINQKSNKDGGYVSVLKSDDLIETAAQIVDRLIKLGVDENDIAILTFTNKDIDEIKEGLKERLKNISLIAETSSSLINSKEALTLINFIKYLYFKNELYKANFLSLIGLNPFDSLNLDAYKDISLQEAIFKVMQEYKILSANAFIFLEQSFKFDSFKEFIEKIEYLEVPMAKDSAKGVRVLTIHKSKGLEFKYVIVLDRIGNKNILNDPLIFKNNDLALDRIFLRSSLRESLDDDYKEAVEIEKKLQDIDLLNQLYVAFTRAEDALFVVYKKDGEIEKLELNECEIGNLEIQKKEKKEISSPQTIKYESKFYGKQELPLYEEDEFKPNDFSAIYLGLAQHAIFELLTDLDENSLKDAIMSVFNQYANLVGKDEIKGLEESIKEILNSQFMQELKEAKIYKEVPFLCNGKFGRVDLLAFFKDRVIIVDFKSATLNQSEYSRQINFYKESITKILGLSTEGYIAMLREKRFIKI